MIAQHEARPGRQAAGRPGSDTVVDAGLMNLVVEHTPAAIAVVDTDMRYLLVSRRWLTDHGLTATDVIGVSHYELFPDVPERWRIAHRQALQGETLYAEEDRFERTDGRVDWVRWSLHPWYQANGAVGGLVIFAEVITRQKEQEMALRRLSTVLHQMTDPLVLIDSDNRLVEVNDAAAGWIGRNRDQIVGRRVEDLVLASQWPAVRDLLDRCRAGERMDSLQAELPDPSGSTMVPMLVTFSLVSNPEADGGDVAVVAKDLTGVKRSQAALFSLTQRFAEARQSESLATFSLGMAHDLNNLLTVIQGSAEQLENEVTSPLLTRTARRIITAGRRAAILTDQLLAISQSRPPRLDRLDLGRLLDERRHDLERRDDNRITVRLATPAEDVIVLADLALVDEILANVLANSAEAMPTHDVVDIDLTTVTVDDGGATEVGIAPGAYARLAITDFGEGMPPDVVARAFEPMFTTKTRGRGTGLGLAVARSMVKSMDGHIDIESEVGRGTTVTVLLPLAPGMAEAGDQ